MLLGFLVLWGKKIALDTRVARGGSLAARLGRGVTWGRGVLTCLSRWGVANGAHNGCHSSSPSPLYPQSHTYTY